MTQEEMQKALEAVGKSGITVNGDLVLSKHVESEIGNVEDGGIGIQNNYYNNVSKSSRQPGATIPFYVGSGSTAALQKKAEKKVTSDKPQTLKYFVHGNNGVLMRQRKRVDIVFRKFTEWGWIDDKTNPDDFDAFFEGEPRRCNITWTGNSTILTILLQELLKQSYILKQTGCSAKSLVEQQFGKTANSDRKRLSSSDEERIKITLIILDIKIPLQERHGRDDEEEYDISDAALQEIYGGLLRSTKGI